MTNEQNYPKRITTHDWEQWRCDIAMHTLAAMLSNPNADRYGKESACRNAVVYADILIKILKEEKQ